MFNEYGKLSTTLYQHTKPIGRSVGGDIEYYKKCLKDESGLILEAGVGTGRMLIPLIQEGLRVDGVDLSSDMLNQCKVNLDKFNINTNLYHQDLTKMALPNKYNAIIMPTGSFCLLPKNLIKTVLDSFLNHLENGGKIIIDLLLPLNFKENEVVSYDYQLQDNKGILFTSVSQSIDWIEQKTSYIHRYEMIENSFVTETEVSKFELHWYGIQEFELLLQMAGFKQINYILGYEKSEKLPITFMATKN